MKTQDGRLLVVGGASRSGKTAWVKKATAKAKRVSAWDPEDQWAREPGYKRVTSRAALLEALKKAGPLKVAYVAGGDLKEEFDFWARATFYATRYVEAIDAIGEELADVSNPAKAPPWWGVLCRRGLKRGGNIYALSQRWSEADKTAFGNAMGYVIFRQSSADDVRYFSRKTDIPEADIKALLPTLAPNGVDVLVAPFIMKDALTGEIRRDALRFRQRP
jgi:hypothetical protein